MKNLKQLNTLREKTRKEISVISSQIQQLEKEKKLKEDYFSYLSREVSSITQDIIFTEHSLLQYIKRVLKIDIDQVKREMLTEKDKEIIKELKSCKYPKPGFELVVKNNVVVTVTVEGK